MPLLVLSLSIALAPSCSLALSLSLSLSLSVSLCRVIPGQWVLARRGRALHHRQVAIPGHEGHDRPRPLARDKDGLLPEPGWPLPGGSKSELAPSPLHVHVHFRTRQQSHTHIRTPAHSRTQHPPLPSDPRAGLTHGLVGRIRAAAVPNASANTGNPRYTNDAADTAALGFDGIVRITEMRYP